MRSTRVFAVFVFALIASCHKSDSTTAPVTPVASVVLTPNGSSIIVGQTTQFTATELDANGLPLSARTVTWSSSDTTVAIVSTTGLATAKQVGTVTITAASETKTGTSTINVLATPLPSIASVTISPAPAVVRAGSTVQLSAIVKDTAGTPISGAIVSWSSDNPGVASVNATGLVTGVLAGSATITAQNGGHSGSGLVTVAATLAKVPPTVQIIPSTASVAIGRTVQLTATATDSIGDFFPNASVVWTSANTSVATVSSSGLVTGIAAGTAAVTATTFGVSSTALITVPVVSFASATAGDLHSCALTPDGTPWCWGGDQANQLGDGLSINSTAPVPVAGGLKFTSISAGWAHSCALTATGTAYCWGDNFSGELGDGTTTHRATPVAVATVLRFSSVSAGEDHSCALTANGSAYCWGSDLYGQLGDGSNTSSTTPVAVAGSLRFKALSTGFGFSCGVTTGGAAYCWGANARGQLGTGTTTPANTPTLINSSASFAAISAGYQHACAVNTSGAAYCWGLNDAGQLGTGDTQSLLTPAAVTGNVSFATIGVGEEFSCGIGTDGKTYCWGDNVWGELGIGTTDALSTQPVPVGGGVSFRSISVGSYHVCGMSVSRVAYCWGDNAQGQLGNGSTSLSPLPAKVLYQP